MNLHEQLQQTVGAIRRRSTLVPKIGIILGSGLGGFASSLTDATAIPYGELPDFPTSSVAGHAGQLVLGHIGDTAVVAMSGRVHMYEGYAPAQAAFPARVLCALGIETLVVTNAAGGIRADLQPADLMILSDHINLSGTNPLTGHNDDRLGPRFPDMSAAYHPALRELLLEVGTRQGLSLTQGVYVQVSGPSYETPAEIRMLRTLGADAVGMSTVPEVIVASHMGVRCAGISCITNLAAGISKTPLSHEEVGETAALAAGRFEALLREFMPLAARLPGGKPGAATA